MENEMRDEIRAQQMADAFEPFRDLDFTDSKAKVQQNRPLKADGAAGRIALCMLSGNFLSIQGAVGILSSNGIVSNDVGRRFREARAWLTKRGIGVVSRHSWSNNYYMWGVVPDAEIQSKLINQILGIK